jgi:hypothetical protein
MGTLVTNQNEIRAKKNKAPKLTQIQKLQTGLKTNDLSLIEYTGKCDALGGECACGKKGIIYRFFVRNPDGEIFVVGSECINHFVPAVQNDIRSHEKQLKAAVKKKAQDEIDAYKENAQYDYCKPLRDTIINLCNDPVIVAHSIYQTVRDIEGIQANSEILKSRIFAIKAIIEQSKARI